MKTPLRGEMLRGADFIIGVVSARARDPIRTIFCDRHGAYDLYAKTWSRNEHCAFLVTGRQAALKAEGLTAFWQSPRFPAQMLSPDTCVGLRQNKVFGLTR